MLDRIIITDASGKRTDFDYKAYLDSGDEKLLPKLKPLDQIFVPASPLTGKVQVEFDGRTLAASGDGSDAERSVKVFGEVGAPAVYSWKPGMNVLDVLMRAGGVTRSANRRSLVSSEYTELYSSAVRTLELRQHRRLPYAYNAPGLFHGHRPVRA